LPGANTPALFMIISGASNFSSAQLPAFIASSFIDRSNAFALMVVSENLAHSSSLKSVIANARWLQKFLPMLFLYLWMLLLSKLSYASI